MKSYRSLCFMTMLFLALMMSFYGKCESVYWSNEISNTDLFVWNDRVMAACCEERFLARRYTFYSLSPEGCVLLDAKSIPFNAHEYYKTSDGLMFRRRVYSAAPFSYSIVKLEYAFCDESLDNPFGQTAFHDIQVDQGDWVALSDGKLLRIQEDAALSCYDTAACAWEDIALPCQLMVNNLNFRDSCVCVNYANAVYYSPSANGFYHFPAVSNQQLVNYVLYGSSLIYSDKGGVYRCADGAESAVLLLGLPDGDAQTAFCISGHTVYAYDHRASELYRWSLANDAPLPTIHLEINRFNYCIFENCVYSLANTENPPFLVNVFDLTTQTEKTYPLDE